MRLGGEKVSDSLLVIVVKAVRGAFSGRISWHTVFLFNVTAQVSQCLNKGGAEVLSSEKEKQNYVQFCTEGKKEIPLNVTSSLSFPLAENGLLFLMCICKLVLPKYKHFVFLSTPDDFCCYNYC